MTIMISMIDNPARYGSAALPSTVYVTGDRRSTIVVTNSGGLTSGAPNNALVDGSKSNNSSNSTYFNSGQSASGSWIKFAFSVAELITEAKWYQDMGDTHGVWKWQGSTDNTNWTDIGGSFTLGGVNQTQTTLNGNISSYVYYRLAGVSGSMSNNPWLQEIEFKQYP